VFLQELKEEGEAVNGVGVVEEKGEEEAITSCVDLRKYLQTAAS
jgi:hypothetical protein